MAVFTKFIEYAQNAPQTISPSAFGARGLYDLPYVGDDRHVHLTDLFLPKSRHQKRPVILHVHGGAWSGGSRVYTRGFCALLASAGFAVLTVDYSDAEDGDLPKQVRDVIAAMRWIGSNASVYGLDQNTVFLTGDSAGAHLAMLAYIVGHDSTLRLLYGAQDVPFTAKAFGLISPVADLRFITDSILPQERAMRRKLFGEAYADSPYRYCSSITDVLRPEMHLPPVWLVSSEDDFFRSQSEDLHHVLNRRNVENEFRFLSGSTDRPLGHGFAVLDPARAESKAIINEMAAFFRERIM